MNWKQIAQSISTATGQPFQPANPSSIGGGCINSAFLLSGPGQSYFVKTNSANRLDMFEAEAEGLSEMANAEAVRIPAPICTGITDDQAYIVMEYISISGRGGGNVMADFAGQLAQMHRKTSDRFGWHRENTIGSTPQPNHGCHDWLEFWQQHRLGFQLQMAAGRGMASSAVNKGQRLQERLGEFFTDHQPEASLLHGDLWSGNYGISDLGEPVIFDPAVYFGDREADIAMTELFGGFGRDFYAAYNSSWPLDSGYKTRKTLYNLYHILNHFNMFGGGYGSQAEGMMDRLLSELG